jgi:hypothetical protein
VLTFQEVLRHQSRLISHDMNRAAHVASACGTHGDGPSVNVANQ